MGGVRRGGRRRPSATGGGCDGVPAAVIRPARIVLKLQLQNRGFWRAPHVSDCHGHGVMILAGRADQQLSAYAPRGARNMGERNGHPMGREFNNVASPFLAIPSLQPETASRCDGSPLSLRPSPVGATGCGALGPMGRGSGGPSCSPCSALRRWPSPDGGRARVWRPRSRRTRCRWRRRCSSAACGDRRFRGRRPPTHAARVRVRPWSRSGRSTHLRDGAVSYGK